MNTTTKATLKLGDTVTATYGNVTVTGVIDGFSGGWVMLKFLAPQDLGNRIETDGVGIDPGRLNTIKLVSAGPALTWDDVVVMPVGVGGGQWLRAGAVR